MHSFLKINKIQECGIPLLGKPIAHIFFSTCSIEGLLLLFHSGYQVLTLRKVENSIKQKQYLSFLHIDDDGDDNRNNDDKYDKKYQGYNNDNIQGT